MKVWHLLIIIILASLGTYFYMSWKDSVHEREKTSIQQERDSLNIQLERSQFVIDSLQNVKDSVKIEYKKVVKWREAKKDEVDTLSSDELISDIKKNYLDTITLEKIRLSKVEYIVVDSISLVSWYNTIQDEKESFYKAILLEHSISLSDDIIKVLQKDKDAMMKRYVSALAKNDELMDKNNKLKNISVISGTMAGVLLLVLIL